MSALCPNCTLDIEAPAEPALDIFCPGCRRNITVMSGPALKQGRSSLPGLKIESTALETNGGATCYSCQQRAAARICAHCGGYTCLACTAMWFDQAYCLKCLHELREVKRKGSFSQRTLLYDNIALGLMIMPLFVPFYGFFISMLLAPVALYLVLRHRRASRGVPPRGPFRLWLAGSLSGLLILAGLSIVGFAGWGIGQINKDLAELRTTDEKPITDYEESDQLDTEEPNAGESSESSAISSE